MKKILFKVSNLSNGLMKLVPEMAVLVNEMIAELDSKQKGKIKGQIDMAFLKAHLYSLSQYKRKTAINSAYEMAVTRAVKLGILMNTDKEQFSVNDKNEVLVMDKIATPMIDQFKKGQKGGSTKIANDSPVNYLKVNNIIVEAQKKKINSVDRFEKIIENTLKSIEKTILIAIYNNQNQRRYVGVKLD